MPGDTMPEAPMQGDAVLEALTDVGLVRAANQDAAIAEALPDGASLLAVADGLGGHAGGEVASELAIGALAASLRASDGEPPEAALRRAFAAANEAVRSRRRGALAEMCTTLVAALVRPDGGGGSAARVANAGDSRAYLVAGGEARRLTRDHSWVEEEVRAGRLDPAAPEAALRRHVVTRAIGLGADAGEDSYGPIALPPGGVLLLCSDGLHGPVPAAAVAEAASDARPGRARRLIEAALARGGPDNVAVALLALPDGA